MPEPHVKATVFGLDVHGSAPLSFLQAATAAPTGRALELAVLATDIAASGWPGAGQVVCDERELDGTVHFRIEAHADAGYLIWGPTYGQHMLSADGRRLWCVPGDCAEDAWQRLLIGQVLPFAALLRGLEVLHASAVIRNGSAIALVGPSGAGKTSVAFALCGLGASFLADDVLALERSGTQLLGHPGPPLIGLDHAEALRTTRADGAKRQAAIAVNAREQIVRVEGASGPAPLAALFFLDRRPDGPARARFEPVADARLLLAATFNSVLDDPTRLLGLLDICALVAQLHVERIVVGPAMDATGLAGEIERRLGERT